MEPISTENKARPTSTGISKPLHWLTAGISWRAQLWSQRIREAKTTAEVWVRHTARINQPEQKLIDDSRDYWSDEAHKTYKQDSHWRGGGIFADESRWLALGLEHVRIYEQFVQIAGLQVPLRRVTEWGCGGGMNAIHFGQFSAEFCGIDVAPASLQECAKQMELAGLHNFAPVLIDASDPEAAFSRVPGPCDLFLCTYVYECFPSPAYGIRVLRVAYNLMAAGGMAIVQIKYQQDWKSRSRMWDYGKNLAWHTTYRIEEFWQVAEQCGFIPKMVTLIPQQTLINDCNYAYFLLLKPISK